MHMNKLTIVQHNDLVESNYYLNINEIRLIFLALTKINSCRPDVGTIEIYPNEFAEMYSLPQKNIHRNMKSSLNIIERKSALIKCTNESKENKLLPWLADSKYYTNQNSESKIELRFSNEIIPYLFELTGNFTIINAHYVKELKSPFSFRLYQWLIREQIHKNRVYQEVTLTLQTIKERFSFSNSSYPKWRDFKSRIIQPAVNEINYKTNLSVTYEVITQGKKIYALTFTYIDEKNKRSNKSITVKPIRPYLNRRPKVKKGSHQEGEWKRKNLQILTKYLQDLVAWDPKAKLEMKDLKKIVSYSKIFDPNLHHKMNTELLKRQAS